MILAGGAFVNDLTLQVQRPRGELGILGLEQEGVETPRWSTDFKAFAVMRNRTDRPSASEMSVTLHKLGRNRRFDLRFEWLTLWPVSAILPVKSQRRDMSKASPCLSLWSAAETPDAPRFRALWPAPIVKADNGRQATPVRRSANACAPRRAGLVITDLTHSRPMTAGGGGGGRGPGVAWSARRVAGRSHAALRMRRKD